MFINTPIVCFGKWILCGEHTVLRGGTALAFPLKSRQFNLEFHPGGDVLKFEFEGVHGPEVQIIFDMIVDQALKLLKKTREDVLLKGSVKVSNNIPIGAGLGASAALCVSVTKWLKNVFSLEDLEIVEFSRQLENIFHGESSGVDVMVASTGMGVRFNRGSQPEFANWPSPPGYLFISHCGKPGVTREAVSLVKNLFVSNPALAEALDLKMKAAVRLGEEALVESRFDLLQESIEAAGDCFRQWGLTQGAVDSHMSLLLTEGASACKPTGSGGGGFVLSLWRTAPSVEVTRRLGLISCF